MSFISLEEFLCLTDPLEPRYPCSVWKIRPRAENWVKYYRLAKDSFDLYGENGPPVGSTVITLQSGHGGGAGVFRIFGGVYEHDDREFGIYRMEGRVRQYSLVPRAHWWTEIYAISKKEYDANWRAWSWLND